jgi:hypothetical protein
MYTNHRHYILTIFAVLAVGVSIFGYITMWNVINEQAGEYSRMSAETLAENEQKKHQQDLASVYTQSTETRNSIKTFIVSQEKIVEFLDIVEKIGIDSGAPIDVSGINTGEFTLDSSNAIGHFSVHITSSGSWSGIMKVLMLIEYMPYSVSLNNIHISKGGDKNSKWDLALDLRILTTK